MTLAEQVKIALAHVSENADAKEVRRIIGRFNHNAGMYKFHDVTKADKILAKKVRLAAQRLSDLIYKGKLTALKIKFHQRSLLKERLSALTSLAEIVETEALGVRGNIDRTDRKLAIECASRLLLQYPPSDPITTVMVAALASELNGEPKERANYVPLVRQAKNQGAI